MAFQSLVLCVVNERCCPSLAARCPLSIVVGLSRAESTKKLIVETVGAATSRYVLVHLMVANDNCLSLRSQERGHAVMTSRNQESVVHLFTGGRDDIAGKPFWKIDDPTRLGPQMAISLQPPVKSRLSKTRACEVAV